jgi:hypothetical protein
MAGIRTAGYGWDLDEVKAAFRNALERYKAWQKDADSENP